VAEELSFEGNSGFEKLTGYVATRDFETLAAGSFVVYER
jgi:hypothetical protein